MTSPTLYDNDVVLKLGAYGMSELISGIPELAVPAILAIATYSLPSQAARIRRIIHRQRLIDSVALFVATSTVIVPTAEELELAASFEEQAIAISVALDSGESQLVAVLLSRGAYSDDNGPPVPIEMAHLFRR